jgi:hypothetical protein
MTTIIVRINLTMVATKPEDLQGLYKVNECHAIFIFLYY